MTIERGLWRAVVVVSVLSMATTVMILQFISPEMRLYRAHYYNEAWCWKLFAQNEARRDAKRAAELPLRRLDELRARRWFGLSADEQRTLAKLEADLPKLTRDYLAIPSEMEEPAFCTQWHVWWIDVFGKQPPWVFVFASTALVGAVPWGIWYVARWIVRGFFTSTKAN